jgi:hypothetical protein
VDYSREELITLIDCSDKICEELILEATLDLVRIHGTPVDLGSTQALEYYISPDLQ